MSDRALRDEIEVLYSELKAERAKADAPLAGELAKARQALVEELAELNTRKQHLRDRLKELEQLKDKRLSETEDAKRELSKTRATIAEWEPLGNPLAESFSNWETPPQQGSGCAIGVWVIASVGLSALGWWLS